ncbi:MAG: hypothetical protein K0R40_2759 [Burkholderiales bacterium]|jgi:hypothetical protein|nr:hypothetical protein [Burkholderiales bacterium]
MSKKNQAAGGTEVLEPGADAAKSDSAQAGEAAAATGGGAASVPPPPNDETRIRQQAQAKLEQKTGELAVKLSQAEARANGLQGELDRERTQSKSLQSQVAELTAALAAATTAAKNAGTAIAGLPENARQLNECVTIASGVAGVGKGGRLHAKAGDVLIVTKSDDDVAELQQELGLQAVVYRVSKETLADLEQSGFLHS